MSIFGLIAALIIAFQVACAIKKDAKQRYEEGSSAPILWALGVFSLMIVFLPIYLLIRPKKLGEQQERIRQIAKKCPQCAEMIKLEALKCRYCGYEFDKHKVEGDVDKHVAKAIVEIERRKSQSKRTWGSILLIFGIILGSFLLLVLFVGILTDQSQDKSAGIIGSLFFIIMFSVIPIIIGLNLKKKAGSAGVKNGSNGIQPPTEPAEPAPVHGEKFLRRLPGPADGGRK